MLLFAGRVTPALRASMKKSQRTTGNRLIHMEMSSLQATAAKSTPPGVVSTLMHQEHLFYRIGYK
jgi:hypothetical protein